MDPSMPRSLVNLIGGSIADGVTVNDLAVLE